MTTATGTRQVPFSRKQVWRALTIPTPYCAVCDVSYVFAEAMDDGDVEEIGMGARFVCVRGPLHGTPPPRDAVEGEVVEWVAQQRIGTRLELAPETWLTVVELADAGRDATDVTVTVTHRPKVGGRLRQALQRRAIQKAAWRTVDLELAKLPDHIRQLAETQQARTSVEDEPDGPVLYLRGDVDGAVIERLKREDVLGGPSVVAIDVVGLTHIDATAFPVLFRWAQRLSRDSRPAVIRGDSPYFDEMSAVMGMTSAFVREGRGGA